jgi:hypothetical protein
MLACTILLNLQKVLLCMAPYLSKEHFVSQANYNVYNT